MRKWTANECFIECSDGMHVCNTQTTGHNYATKRVLADTIAMVPELLHLARHSVDLLASACHAIIDAAEASPQGGDELRKLAAELTEHMQLTIPACDALKACEAARL